MKLVRCFFTLGLVSLFFCMSSFGWALPDLTVTDIWNENGYAHFQVWNKGDQSTGFSWGLKLQVEGQDFDSLLPQMDIQPGKRWEGSFPKYVFSQTNPVFPVTVIADPDYLVKEENENNNSRTEMWNEDETPPVFLTGPNSDKITKTSAVIQFSTDEDVDASVYYSRFGGVFTEIKKSEKPGDNFSIPLSKLEPGAIYRYAVQITNTSDLRTTSTVRRFATSGYEDSEPPSAKMTLGKRRPGTSLVPLIGNVSDNKGVDRVEFYMDGKLMSIDYSFPFEEMLDIRYHKPAPHDIEIIAWDFAGNKSIADIIWEFSPNTEGPEITPNFTFPDPVGGVFDMDFTFHDSPDGMKYLRFYVDDVLRESSGELRFGIMGPEGFIDMVYETLDYTFTWNTFEETNGEHEVRIEAEDPNRNVSTWTETVTIDNPEFEAPEFVMTEHDFYYSDYSNTFNITMTFENTGEREADSFEIIDYEIRGFQSYYSSCSVVNNLPYDDSPVITQDYEDYGTVFKINPGADYYIPGSRIRISIQAVPLLTAPNMYSPVIARNGEYSYTGDWRQGSRSGTDRWEAAIPALDENSEGENISEVYYDILGMSDYVILTCPFRLFRQFGGGYFEDRYSEVRQPVVDILKAMGELASVRNGVVGYVAMTMDRSEINALMRSGGPWAEHLDSGFPGSGYLLLVGETEILPGDDIVVDAVGRSRRNIYPSDMLYADTSGNRWRPELKVGRIIGNESTDLVNSMQTSIYVSYGFEGYDFDTDKAVVYSGDDSGKNMFRSCAADLQDQARSYYSEVLRGRVDDNALHADFVTDIPGSDYIVYRGHGGYTSWADVTNTSWIDSADLVDGRPVVIGWACRSGQYESSSDPDFIGLGEDFMNSGAGAYVGAVKNSPRGENNDAARKFQSDMLVNRYDVGTCLKKAKRIFKTDYSTCTSCNYDNRRIAATYNLYGDPKYGRDHVRSFSRHAAGAKKSLQTISGDTTLDISIPEINFVENDDGTFYPLIEGHGHYGVPGNPVIPAFKEQYEVSPDTRILDIQLTKKGDEKTTEGVNIEIDLDAEGNIVYPGPYPTEAPDDEWWPRFEFDWSVDEEEGSRILTLTVLPMNVLRARAEVISFHKYVFDVTTKQDHTVEIEVKDAPKPVLPGEYLNLDVRMTNSGDTRDVFLDVGMGLFGSDEFTSGLPSRMLKDLAGTATLTLEVPTGKIPPGIHRARVSLLDKEEQPLASDTGLFEVMGEKIAVTKLMVDTPLFQPGDKIDISMIIHNDGSVNADGAGHLIIRNGKGDEIKRYSETITDLAPGKTIIMKRSWDTTGFEEDFYWVTGFATFERGQSNTENAQIIRVVDNPCTWFSY